jgi:hypothetical protein
MTPIMHGPLMVRVDTNDHGGWDVAVPDRSEHITCESLDDARRIAYLCATHRGPCELVVCDAYHRVVGRELVT